MEFDAPPAPISLIYPGLYLGTSKAAANKPLLTSHGITHIICCAEEITPAFPGEFQYLVLPVDNQLEKSAFQYFHEARKFIDDALSGASASHVLVHWYGSDLR